MGRRLVNRFGARRVCVLGLGRTGFAAADSLLQNDVEVVVVSGRADDREQERAALLRVLGADVRLGRGADTGVPDGVDLVVTSPGVPPRQPLLAAAAAAGLPIWSEVELAWQLQPEAGRPAWLTLTGTNGKTTTVQMLSAVLTAAGRRVATVGNVGRPVVEAVCDPQPVDVFAVELSSFQLHWTHSVSPVASACLNLAEDHVDWYAGVGGLAGYAADKARVFERTQVACVYNVQDPATERMVAGADVVEGARAIGFTLGVPAPGQVGVVDDVLADRAFVENRRTEAAELCTLADLQGDAPTLAPHTVANALAAAALARAYGVPPVAVRDGLVGFRPDHHRIAHVATVDGVDFVDDSKATNPHAAAASLSAFDHVVWVAGGLLKGADVDDLVRTHAPRLRAAVLIGRDRAAIVEAIARHAPDVPVVQVESTDTGVMDQVVEHARALARSGDTVLLAPAAASMDMFRDYAQRGEEFADAVRRMAARRQGR
ncbi:MAG TPA: UDP-N-acetylmuramoyl-L-alanine--D-glutamate ligase [Actinomycetales bacterium]|nr:UDP-N-acetylmuramoyl-L-alanine--D-glutamate ligase [Actinomycetales bacterium]